MNSYLKRLIKCCAGNKKVHWMILTSLLMFQVFEEEASSWEEKLNRILALFDVWIDVQRR